ncbi:hypothetical protein L1D14_07565 [Vibrio tubiashii]|uniref:hypothetical protein n=1 Tax=Vibrio tubiashii TaxID=29498 RepID=UPI001EFC4325|nr:hypothetical protein [Vibrio tubiashii]MCG9576096.1 hypothetical protein [Vibrio tubiashii]
MSIKQINTLTDQQLLNIQFTQGDIESHQHKLFASYMRGQIRAIMHTLTALFFLLAISAWSKGSGLVVETWELKLVVALVIAYPISLAAAKYPTYNRTWKDMNFIVSKEWHRRSHIDA